jgi:hypothetical protein
LTGFTGSNQRLKIKEQKYKSKIKKRINCVGRGQPTGLPHSED